MVHVSTCFGTWTNSEKLKLANATRLEQRVTVDINHNVAPRRALDGLPPVIPRRRFRLSSPRRSREELRPARRSIMARPSIALDRYSHSQPGVGYLGVNPQGCTEEEDFTHEEASQTDGWQGSQGCHITQQVLWLRKSQTCTLPMPPLCYEYVDMSWI